MDRVKFAFRLKELRQVNKITTQKLAEAIGLKSKGGITQFEKGMTSPSSDTLIAMANFFNVSTDYLLGRTDNPENTDNEYPNVEAVKIPIYKFNQSEEVFADSNIIGWRDVPAEQMHYKAFQVPDDSMSGIRLHQGDIVLIDPKNIVEDGQVAAVKVIGRSGCIRRVKYSSNGIILYPENPAYDSELLPVDQVQIVGVVTEAIFKVK